MLGKFRLGQNFLNNVLFWIKVYVKMCFRMNKYHRDVLPNGNYYKLKTTAMIVEFILNARWYNWSWNAQLEIAQDIRLNKEIHIRHAPSGVWLRFLTYHNNVSVQQEIFVRLTDIIMVTKHFEVQLEW